MNVEITEKTEVTKVIGNHNCKVTMLNGDITAITVQGDTFVGAIEFQKNFVEFERFLQNCLDVFHTVQMEQIDERKRNTEQGTDCVPSEKR
jgi:hypothetical protein